jgi:hypothetical protein
MPRIQRRRLTVAAGVIVVLTIAALASIALADQSSASTETSHRVGSAAAALTALERPGLSSETGQGLDIDPSTVVLVGSFALPSGGRHEVYRAKSRNGWTCILEERPVGTAPNGEPIGLYGGGCSPGALASNAINISVSGAGNVDEAGTQALSIIGVAGSGVHRVALKTSSGAVLPMTLGPDGGFHFSGNASGPTAVVAFDATGSKVNEKSLR